MFDSIGLFLGALCDALIGLNFVFPGEPFFIAAGYQLQQGMVSGVAWVLLGAWLGDVLSYLLGRRWGRVLQRRLWHWRPGSRRHLARSRYLLKRHSIKVLLFARLLGPVSWVTPFVAGSVGIARARFVWCSLLAVLLGVGQFILWGYLLAYGLDGIPLAVQLQAFVAEHSYLLALLLGTLIIWRLACWRGWARPKSCAALVLVAGLLGINYSHYFMWSDDEVSQAWRAESVTLSNLELRAFPGRSSIYDAQAVNVVLAAETPRHLMEGLGWIENKTFSRHDLELADYLVLLQGQEPPVSDLFWQGEPQWLAYQLPGSLMQRVHIRWWQAGIDSDSGLPLWVGALSYDDGLTLTMYSGIVTLLHSIDPDVDSQRDALQQQVEQHGGRWLTSTLALQPRQTQDQSRDYFTDGGVLYITSPASTEAPTLLARH